MAEAEYPPKTILIGLVLIAVLAIGIGRYGDPSEQLRIQRSKSAEHASASQFPMRPEALEGAAFGGGLRQAAGAASQEAQAATGFLIPKVGFGRRPLAVHKKPGLARQAGPGFLSAESALTPVTYVRTTGLD